MENQIFRAFKKTNFNALYTNVYIGSYTQEEKTCMFYPIFKKNTYYYGKQHMKRIYIQSKSKCIYLK